MDFGINKGIKGSIEMEVNKEHTAAEVGSGAVDVLATPVMVTIIEKVSADTVKELLPEGYTTVGTEINAKHIAPTPCGLKIRADIQIVDADDREITFVADVFDEIQKIGTAVHKRYIVNSAEFIQKAQDKILRK